MAEIPNYPEECNHHLTFDFCFQCQASRVKELEAQLKEAMEHIGNVNRSTLPTSVYKGPLHDEKRPPNTDELQGQGVYMGGIRYEIIGAEVMEQNLATTEIKVMLLPKGPRLVVLRGGKT